MAKVIPAGWYDDPADRRLVRWWNGIAWTEHTAEKPGTGAEGADASPSPPDGRPG